MSLNWFNEYPRVFYGVLGIALILIITIAFLKIEGLRNFFSFPKKCHLLNYVLVCFLIIVQLYVLGWKGDCQDVRNIIIVPMLVSVSLLFWLFAESFLLIKGIGGFTKRKLLLASKDNMLSYNDFLAKVIIMGIMQVGIAMMVAGDSQLSLEAKLIANIIYLVLPAFVVYELQKNPED